MPYSVATPRGSVGSNDTSVQNYLNYQSLQNLNSPPPPVTQGLPAEGIPNSISWHAGVSSAAGVGVGSSSPSIQSKASSTASTTMEPRLRKGMAYSVTTLEYSPGERRREQQEHNKENFPAAPMPVHTSKSAHDLRQAEPQDAHMFRPASSQQNVNKHFMPPSWNRPSPYKPANYENIETFDYNNQQSHMPSQVHGAQPQAQSQQNSNNMTTSYYMAERDRLLGQHGNRPIQGETDLDAPQSPPPRPPTRDISSLRYKGAVSSPTGHERYSSWPTAMGNEDPLQNNSNSSANSRTSWSPSSNSSQDYSKSRTSYQPSLNAHSEEKIHSSSAYKMLSDTSSAHPMDYPLKGALNSPIDGESFSVTKNFSLDTKSELEVKALYGAQASYPYENKDNYVDMAPAPLEHSLVKEKVLEKRFTDIPYIEKLGARKDSLKDSENGTPPPLPSSPPPSMPSTVPPLPPSSQSITINQSFSSSSSGVGTSVASTPRSTHSAYNNTFIVRQTKPYYNTSTQTEETEQRAAPGVLPMRPPLLSQESATQLSPQVECRSVQVSDLTHKG